jgi:hypothetical protein
MFIVKELYGISEKSSIFVNVDEFSSVLDMHANADAFKSAYSSFTSLLGDGMQFAFSGLHSASVDVFARLSGRPRRFYMLPTLPLTSLHEHQAAVCIINAVAANKGLKFSLADYEASKSSVGLMGYALESCCTTQSDWFETPWKHKLKCDLGKHEKLFFDSLKRTFLGEALDKASEKAGLAIRGVNSKLSIHPYALYSLLNEMKTMEARPATPPFEAAVMFMWKSFCMTVHAYHTAIAEARADPASTATAIREAKGPMLEMLLRHVSHLRALAAGVVSRFGVVKRFPTLVDKGTTKSVTSVPTEDVEDISNLVKSIENGGHVVLSATEKHNIADVSVLQRHDDELRIDLYETKHFDGPTAKNEHRNKYIGVLVGLLHLRQKGALSGKVRVQFHYVAVLPPSEQSLKLTHSSADIDCPPEYNALLDPALVRVSIDKLEDRLREEGVIVEGTRWYQSEQELEELLTQPLLLNLPDGGWVLGAQRSEDASILSTPGL